MSIYLTPQMTAASAVTGGARRPEGPFKRGLQAALRNWKRRKLIAALHALDERTLCDIGLHRSEIERFVDRLDDRELAMEPVASRDATVDAVQEAYLKAA